MRNNSVAMQRQKRAGRKFTCGPVFFWICISGLKRHKENSREAAVELAKQAGFPRAFKAASRHVLRKTRGKRKKRAQSGFFLQNGSTAERSKRKEGAKKGFFCKTAPPRSRCIRSLSQNISNHKGEIPQIKTANIIKSLKYLLRNHCYYPTVVTSAHPRRRKRFSEM